MATDSTAVERLRSALMPDGLLQAINLLLKHREEDIRMLGAVAVQMRRTDSPLCARDLEQLRGRLDKLGVSIVPEPFPPATLVATDSTAIERGRFIHELYGVVVKVLAEHDAEAVRANFKRCGCGTCVLPRPATLGGATIESFGPSSPDDPCPVTAPVINGLKQWNLTMGQQRADHDVEKYRGAMVDAAETGTGMVRVTHIPVEHLAIDRQPKGGAGAWCCEKGKAAGVGVCHECDTTSRAYQADMSPNAALNREADPTDPCEWTAWGETLRKLIGDRTEVLHFAADMQATETGVRISNCRFINTVTANDTLRKLRAAQAALEVHEAELRRLATYTRFNPGMKDSRRRHSEQAQIQRDTIRNLLR